MNEPIRLGLLRLCDAAPVILAKHEGLFAEAGLEVALSVEPSWANIADKLAYTRISRMSADFLVQEGRIWHEYQRVIVNEGAREWNTQRVNRMMGLCGSISTGG